MTEEISNGTPTRNNRLHWVDRFVVCISTRRSSRYHEKLLVGEYRLVIGRLAGFPPVIHRDEESGKILNLVVVWANEGEQLKVDVPLDHCPGLKKGENLRSLRSSLKLVDPSQHIPSKIEVD
ncbi:hypothetical protein Rs2_43705 [Raphanus sativus]|nr:hypothetical protein Rs2_43705 [Raphanus sativus]